MSRISSVTAPQGQYVEANGLKIYYEEFGSGEPLILLHGALSTGLIQWKELVTFLSSNFRVIVPDARGHGRTDNPLGEIRLSVLTNDVVAFVNALSLEKPYICGWSKGADTVVDLGIRYPNLVKAMIVGGVTHRLSETYFDGLRELGIEGPGQVNIERVNKTLPGLVGIHAQYPGHFETLIRQISYEIFEQTLPSVEDLRKITAPTLIIWGDRDQFLQIENAVELYRLIPNAELAVIPNADHFVISTNGKLYATIVEGFLLRIKSSAELDYGITR